MMRWLTLSLCLLLSVFPVRGFAGNVAPTLNLEVFYQAEDPTDPEGPGFLYNPCWHARITPVFIPCYAIRVAYNFYIVPIHIGNLDVPICPAPGAGCTDFGGFLGLFFGVASTGTGTLMFMSWNACPGFLRGPSTAGEPAACGASSTAICHDWTDHEGYLVYMNLTSTAARYLTITENADLHHARVISCHSQYDFGTTIGGGVQIGGVQDIICQGPTAVEELTWGKMKTLYW